MSDASDELTDRIRAIIGHKPGVTEKRMFGGSAFMLNGNMVVGGMSTGALLMRVGPERHEEAKKRPGATAMIQGGREMKGFIEVTDDGIYDDDALKDSIDYAWAFVKTMPAKVEKPKASAKKAPATGKPAAKTAKAPAKRAAKRPAAKSR